MSVKEINGVQVNEGLILDFWDMNQAQGLRPKDKFVELHMKLNRAKELVFERFGKVANYLGVNHKIIEAFEQVPNKKWEIVPLQLAADQILIGHKSGDEPIIYYSCITVYNLEKL